MVAWRQEAEGCGSAYFNKPCFEGNTKVLKTECRFSVPVPDIWLFVLQPLPQAQRTIVHPISLINHYL